LEPAALGQLLPAYEILSLLGRGGMGAVYYAVEKALDRPVALKLLPAELSAQPGFAERFTREARAMAKLSHPNIVALHEFGRTSAGHLFFTMEFVEGTTLAAMIHGPGISPEQALTISGQICLALAYAHEQGVVHRDMKPSNVLVDARGQVKIADFGLARLIDPSEVQLGHTLTGLAMGTPDYMSPEQKRGGTVDHRADIYSIGVMLYEMLCRQTPQGAFAPPSKVVQCDASLDRIVDRALQPAPERRYQSTTEMKADVDGVRPAGPQPVRSIATWSMASAAVLLAGFLLWLAWAPVLRWWRDHSQAGTVLPSTSPSALATEPAAPSVHPDRRAAEWLLSVGGTVVIGEKGWREFTKVEDLPAHDFTLIGLTLDAFGKRNFPQPRPEDYQALAGLTGLRHVWFRSVNITDEGLAFLRENRGLRHVQLHGLGQITDAALAHLANPTLEELEIISCPGLRLSDLSQLNSRERIKKLTLVKQDLDNTAVSTLRDFTALESLNLYGNPFTDVGLRPLASLPQLKQLFAHECPNLTGTSLAAFAQSNQLTYLNLRDAGLTDDGYAALRGLTRLRELELSRYSPPRGSKPLTDEHLKQLTTLTNLQTLNIVGTRVTSEGLRSFQEAVPGCKVRRHD
jgi:serine/threonine protein kinase